jgi:hypothetical protein
MPDDPIVAEPDHGEIRRPPRPAPAMDELLDIVWPESGLQTASRVSARPKDTLSDDDVVELDIDFVRLSLSPLEFIQLASFLRMSVDALLDRHPGMQRTVVEAFDIRD